MDIKNRKRLLLVMLVPGLSLMSSASLQAKISAPHHVLYGSATYFESAIADGSSITAIIAGQSQPVVAYAMGSDVTLGSFYALRIPMDTVNPRSPGTARAGEQITLYINGEAAAETQVGALGKAVRLDIDPLDLTGGGPGASVGDIDVVEGDTGETHAQFIVSLTTNTDYDVTVDWATSDSSAVGGAVCDQGVDYLSSSGQVTVPTGDMSATFNVSVCGDTVDEFSELFKVSLSNAVNGYIADGIGFAEILDDDTLPTLIIDDVQVIEPATGGVDARFTVSLSEVWDVDITVDYETYEGTAVAADFTAVAGTLIIKAGDPTGEILVPVVADADLEPNETFSVVLSNPQNVDIEDDTGIATIVDPVFEPMLEISNKVDLWGSGPSSIVVSPDGGYAYVGGFADDSITHFHRDSKTGDLTELGHYDVGADGFSEVLLDGVVDLVISSDGSYLYAASYFDDAVSVFAIDAVTGVLSPIASYQDNTLLDGVAGLALSPDNEHLYVVAESANSLSVYATRSAGTGELTFVESKVDDTDEVDGLEYSTAVSLSADGRHLYVAGYRDNAVAVFGRDNRPASENFGQLTYVHHVRDNVAGIEGLLGASSLSVTDDGEYLFVSGEVDHSLVQFKRDPWSGEVDLRSLSLHGDSGIAGLKSPLKVMQSRDGNFIYVLGLTDSIDGSLVVFRRNRDHTSPEFGNLRVIQNMLNGEGTIDLTGPSDMSISPDDQHLYITTSDSVLIIKRLPELIFGSSFN